jgi:hypothetical protein
MFRYSRFNSSTFSDLSNGTLDWTAVTDQSNKVFGKTALDIMSVYNTIGTIYQRTPVFAVNVTFVRGFYLDISNFRKSIMGMAPIGSLDQATRSFVYQLYAEEKIDKPVLSFYMR